MVPAPPPLSEEARGLTQEHRDWLNADLSRLSVSLTAGSRES
jgi:hypothetical protein